jgi:hypothetical protein
MFAKAAKRQRMQKFIMKVVKNEMKFIIVYYWKISKLIHSMKHLVYDIPLLIYHADLSHLIRDRKWPKSQPKHGFAVEALELSTTRD